MERLTRVVDFGFVKSKLIEVLEPDETMSITSETRLSEFEAEPAYFLEVLNELGIHYMRYMSGESLNGDSKILMLNIAKDNGETEKAGHFRHLSKLKTTKQLIKQLTAGDLVDIANYDKRWAEADYADGWRQAVA